MRAATGRDPDEVATAARCLLAFQAYQGGEPTTEQRAGAGIVASHYLDTRLLLLAWTT